MATLKDWKNELAGRSDLDKSEYMDFIPRDGNDSFLKEAFIDLPRGYTLISRIKKLFEENDNSGLYVTPKKENFLPKNALLEMMHSYCDNVHNFFNIKRMRELSLEAIPNNIEVVYSKNEFSERIISGNNSEIETVIGDEFIDLMYEVGDYMSPLKESVIFLTKNSAVTRYLLEDVVGFPLKHEPYYELWKGGGDVFFFKDHVLMLCRHE
ncbi:hypothetical protein [Phyllobacterium sp. P30BS-XVII]|uniref:hypothetical protein n=1 Tax=Phyllobacterium sp. P30BS-XVII TaxID=2587046 RepID=UPI000DD7D624|nr:hypothetical protein [Phyllobacterium sp. P30BS-XVII]MBA8902419.1 hypothetical protein [Phyllobacterium sp. P30BS-XVII]